jgi:hypothetical protein
VVDRNEFDNEANEIAVIEEDEDQSYGEEEQE